MFPRAGRPHGEEVVAVLLDLDAEIDRLDGALLTEDPLQFCEFIGRLERERFRVAAVVELLGLQLANFRHAQPLTPS